LVQKRHTLQPIIDGNILSSIDLIEREAEKAKSTLVVCNHVPTAQQVYRELSKKIDDIFLLHSQFCRRDRNEIEDKLIGIKYKNKDDSPKKLPKILVATQVIEVSLDIDFEQGFLEPAPIDALVQRLGRINRYGKREQAKVWIFSKQQHHFEIYDGSLTNKSLKALSSLPNPLGEEDLNQAADRVYGKGYSPDNQIEYEEGLNYFRLKKFKENLVAGTDQDWVEQVIDEKEGSTDLLPEQLVNEYNMLIKNKLIIDADNLLVPVGNWRKPYLIQEGYIDTSHDPWILMNCQYSSEMGLEI
jgi:CRISPR-associated endonuclease/helicase Cas3